MQKICKFLYFCLPLNTKIQRENLWESAVYEKLINLNLKKNRLAVFIKKTKMETKGKLIKENLVAISHTGTHEGKRSFFLTSLQK